jgi:hypoxanthine phosphoribosyltransferase
VEEFKKRILYTSDEIDRRVKHLAAKISQDYQGKDLILVGVLKGAFIFLADLVRHMSIPVQVDFARVASYGSGTQSSGIIKITKDIEISISGKDVIIVDDIADSGLSLDFFKKSLLRAHPSSLKICVMIDKRSRREVDISLDYVGFSIESDFLVGYGLDCDEQFRCLPEIYEIEE